MSHSSHVSNSSHISKKAGITGYLWWLSWFVGVCFACFASQQVHSQQVATSPQVDGGLAAQVIAKARQLEGQDIDKAISLMLEREKAVIQESSTGQLAAFYNKLAELHATIDSIKKQQSYALKGLNLIGEETIAIAADLHYNLGLGYEMLADFAKAKAHYQKGLNIAEQTGHLLYQGRGKLFLAAIYNSEGNYDLALNTLKEAYSYAQQINDNDFNWEVYNEMSLFYSGLSDHTRALEFAHKALDTAQALNINALEIVALHNLAYEYLVIKELDSANTYLDRMLKLSKDSGAKSDLYAAYKGFALVAQSEKHYERALNYIDKAKEFLPAIEVTLTTVEFYVIRAQILNNLEQSSQALEQIVIAEQLLPVSQRGAKSRMGLRLLRDKSTYHGELGQYRRAYELLREYSRGLREFERKVNDEALRKLRVSFDVERSQTLNEMLEKDNKIKSLQLRQADNERHVQTFFLVVLAVLSIGLIVTMYRQFQARRQLKLFAQTDSLTGLYNRGYVFAKGRQMVSAHHGQAAPLSILMFDVDNFKQVNDSYGHPAGDEVLRSVAQACQSCLRESDMIARFGGEEFIALLPGVDVQTAEFIAGRIKDKIASCEQQVDDLHFSVTASFGVALATQEDDFDGLIKIVDEALYQAKQNGRNCIVVATNEKGVLNE